MVAAPRAVELAGLTAEENLIKLLVAIDLGEAGECSLVHAEPIVWPHVSQVCAVVQHD